MSGKIGRLDDILTESQMEERFPNEPENTSKLFAKPHRIEIRDYEDLRTFSGVSWNMTTPFIDEEVLNGEKPLTDVDQRIIRELTGLIHDGPVRSAYASENLMDEFDEDAVIGEVIMPGYNPVVLQLRDEKLLWDKIGLLEDNSQVNIENWTDIIETELNDNRVLSTALPSNGEYFAENQFFSFIYDEDEDPRRVSDELVSIVDGLQGESRSGGYIADIIPVDREENSSGKDKNYTEISGEDILQDLAEIDNRIIPNNGDNAGDYSLNFQTNSSPEDLRPEIEGEEIVLYDGEEEIERTKLHTEEDYEVAGFDYTESNGTGEIYLKEQRESILED